METIKYVIYVLCFISCHFVVIVYGKCERYEKTLFDPRYYCRAMLSYDIKGELTHIVEMTRDPKIILLLNEIQTLDGILQKNWLDIDYPVCDLHLYEMHINEIEDGAFLSKAFEALANLEISKISLQYLTSRTFVGLSNLHYLRFNDVKILKLGADILIHLVNLEIISMQNFQSKPLYLDNFFGMQNELPYLYDVIIFRCNLSATITEKTFTGLRRVKTLRLDENEIQQIGERSFDVPLKTLTHIVLQRNKLTWIPNNLFQMSVGDSLVVSMSSNPWHCDCQLENLRKFIISQTRMKITDMYCATPPPYKRWLLSTLPDLCHQSTKNKPEKIVKILTTKKPEPDISVVTTNLADGHHATTTTFSYDNGKSPDDDANSITLWCDTSDSTGHMENITFKQILPTIPLVRLIDAHLSIDTEDTTKDFKLFGFEQKPGNNGNLAKCFTNVKNNENIIEVGTNKIHRFCWIQNGLKTISMLNCMSVASNTAEDLSVWITMEHKPIYLIVWTFAVIFGFAVGTLIGILLTKLYFVVFPGHMNDSGMEETAKDIPVYAEIEKVKKPTNKIQQISGENEVLGRFFISEDTPPLPPRNKKIDLQRFKCCNSEQCECYCEL